MSTADPSKSSPIRVPEIHSVLAALAIRRPIYHSEADFQHAIAWQLQLADPTAMIRLEKQIVAAGSRVRLDLLACGADYELAIEIEVQDEGRWYR